MPAPLTTFLLLFRGVGGAVQLPVAKLRAALAKAGLKRPTTYINSGNALVRSALSRDDVHATVAALCKEQFHYERPIFVPTAAEWEAVVQHDPFPDKAEGKHVHAVLLAEKPAPEAVKALQALAVPGEALHFRASPLGPYRLCYLHTPHGFGTSKLAEQFDRRIGVVNTARNWNTVLKLNELAFAMRTQ